MSTPDDDFERLLLRSARDDGPAPGAPERAWAEFSRVTLGAAAAASGATAAKGAIAAASGAAKGPAAAAKWLLLGALGGSALTVATLGALRSPARLVAVSQAAPPSAPLSSAPPLASGSLTPAPSALEVASAPPVLQAPAPAPVALAPGPAPARRGAPLAGPVSTAVSAAAASAQVRGPSPARGPGLAGEVVLLDAARAALSSGANDEALRLVERHQSAFPRGELSADAEAVAIEALAARGDRAEASRRAGRFLERFPRDPHAARVRGFAVE